jgi:hypothetical protein
VIVLALELAADGTATYNFCWLGFQARSLPSRFRIQVCARLDGVDSKGHRAGGAATGRWIHYGNRCGGRGRKIGCRDLRGQRCAGCECCGERRTVPLNHRFGNETAARCGYGERGTARVGRVGSQCAECGRGILRRWRGRRLRSGRAATPASAAAEGAEDEGGYEQDTFPKMWRRGLPGDNRLHRTTLIDSHWSHRVIS